MDHLKRMLLDVTKDPIVLPLSLLKNITNDFSNELEIGRGGFSVVYKGILDNGTIIAVKRLSNTYMYEKEFHREVECLMKLKHKNIVRFLGYCSDTIVDVVPYKGNFVLAETQERLMCFEYIHGGSLERYIKDTSGGLEWRDRYIIIKGICEGLQYLHQNFVLHMDLKPANILMGEDMMPKITDFGLSRCFEEMQTRSITTKMGGTFGYLAPEFGSREITYKFDLYSLGVIIKEILTGKKGYQDVENILESWSNRSDISQSGQIRVCAEIGVKCTDFNPAKRPASINHILESLLETESTQAIPIHGPSELLYVHQFKLYFPFETNKVITCPLKVTSKSDRYVAFRLRDISLDSFLSLPVYGIVPPRSVYTIDVKSREHEELPRKTNVDLVLESATIVGNDYIRSFHSRPTSYFSKAKIMGNMAQENILKAFCTPQSEVIGSSKIGTKLRRISDLCMQLGSKLYHELFEHTGSKPKHFTLQHLKDLTNNFSDDRILGIGGFSVVYKGVLQNGDVVAVKKFTQTISTSKHQFENEVDLLTELRHPNIVQLIGYCYETQHMHVLHGGKPIYATSAESLLCLEYLPNGSLDKYISDASSGFDWHTRRNIIEGVCLGLQYLHEHYNGPIIHLDLKPANILLDKNMVPKIADFGQSRLFTQTHSMHTAITTGTFGYMPPEYLRGIITPMHDIFSLGVIILEVITGHRDYPYDTSEDSESFIQLEVNKWRNVLREQRADASLFIDFHQIKLCLQVGLMCVNMERTNRPTIKEIVNMLHGL